VVERGASQVQLHEQDVVLQHAHDAYSERKVRFAPRRADPCLVRGLAGSIGASSAVSMFQESSSSWIVALSNEIGSRGVPTNFSAIRFV
jgi:hypothetical protein